MGVIYAYLIIDGYIAYKDVRAFFKPATKEALIRLGAGELAVEA